MNETESIKVLEKAISDVGYWTWWDTLPPDTALLEFGGIQLYLKNEDPQKPPFSIIALQFFGLRSFCFLSRTINNINGDWYTLLHQDKLNYPHCDYDYFTLTDEMLMKNMLSFSETVTIIAGASPEDMSFWQGKYKLVFWAKDYGCAVSADKIRLFAASGELLLGDVPNKHMKWWDYWKRYYELTKTNNPMPKDYACEATIPVNCKSSNS